MNFQEAVERLRQAGLYVRPADPDILGGSHVDATGLIRMVHNGFGILAEADKYRLKTHRDGQGEGLGGLALEEAVQRVIEAITPQPNIEEEPKSTPKGTVLY